MDNNKLPLSFRGWARSGEDTQSGPNYPPLPLEGQAIKRRPVRTAMNHKGHEGSQRALSQGFPLCAFVPFVVRNRSSANLFDTKRGGEGQLRACRSCHPLVRWPGLGWGAVGLSSRVSVLCEARDLGEPREASRSLRRNSRAFGSLPYPPAPLSGFGVLECPRPAPISSPHG